MNDDQFLTLLEEAEPLGGLPETEEVTVEEAKKALRQMFDDFEAYVSEGSQPGTPVAEQRAATIALLRTALLAPLGALRTPQPRRARPPDRGIGLPIPRIRIFSEPPPARERPPEPPRVHLSTLSETAKSAFAAARRLLVAAKPPPPEKVIQPWAADAELVGHLHLLLSAGEAGDGELALGYVGDLRNALRQRHGIDVVTYDGHNDELFQIHECVRPEDSGRTRRPALTAQGELLRRGEAVAVLPVPDQGEAVAVLPVPDQGEAVAVLPVPDQEGESGQDEQDV
ncbi:hypothetical protein [Nonomuraea insulae]|uniref:Uncharacterized protein n=1 Tax=Nonomuraea insulae TaxID=1616787 RepID=A0ABW1C990_9ACTN